LVAKAESESAVKNVTEVASVTITTVQNGPTVPRTQPNRRYITTPKIVRILGVNTPLNVPNPYPCFFSSAKIYSLIFYIWLIAYFILHSNICISIRYLKNEVNYRIHLRTSHFSVCRHGFS
jgi:hypothetical protein